MYIYKSKSKCFHGRFLLTLCLHIAIGGASVCLFGLCGCGHSSKKLELVGTLVATLAAPLLLDQPNTSSCIFLTLTLHLQSMNIYYITNSQ
jgi:hypothetical protein